MAKQMTTEQAVGAFRFRAAALIQQGNMAELRELFADCTAAAMMVEGDEALEEMSYVLRDMLAAPLHDSERGTFTDMRYWGKQSFDDMRRWKKHERKDNYHDSSR
jgi:hypothetical protein